VKAVVVYESLWGNTAAVAHAIAEGIGDGAQALTTTDATAEAMTDVDLVVVGAPLIAFSLATNQSRDNIRTNPGKPPSPPDLAHPSMRDWLDALPEGSGRSAAFETRFRWSPGSATKSIERELVKAGYSRLAEPGRFMITGRYGPLREGEVERARVWGAELARTAREGG